MSLAKINKKFPFQVWGGSILLYAFWLIILALLSTNLSSVSGDFFPGALFIVLASAYISIPTFVLYTLVFFWFTSKLRSVVSIKVIQSGIAFLGMLLTFFLLPENSLLNPGDDIAIFLLGYLLSIILPSLYFKLVNLKPEISTTQLAP